MFLDLLLVWYVHSLGIIRGLRGDTVWRDILQINSQATDLENMTFSELLLGSYHQD